MNTNSIAQEVVIVWDERATFDMMKPDDLGEMDALQGYPFCPEMYFIKHADKCLYAAGFANVVGPSYLTNAFLLGETVECIEDDDSWNSRGMW